MAKKKFKDLKKSRDIYFRKRAKNALLAPVTDLNAEIRQQVKKAKGNKADIQSQKNKLRSLEKENRKIRDSRRELEKQLPFQDDEGKKKIEIELAKPDYKTKDLSEVKNRLRAVEGKDFNFIVDDGFKKYNINTRQLKAIWRKGGDASLVILKKMGKNTEESLRFYNDLIEKEKKTAPKSRMKKLKRIRDGLEKKLKHTIEKNIEAVETGDLSSLDEVSDEDEKAYSILFKVIGLNIDRIGI